VTAIARTTQDTVETQQFIAGSTATFIAQLSLTPPAPTSSPTPQNGMIAFVSNRAGNNDIYVINPDRTGLKLLTDDSSSDSFPSWSPDGQYIVFTSDMRGGQKLFIMNKFGALVRQLTSGEGEDYGAKWSPDGETIVFSSNRSGAWKIYTISRFGGEVVDILKNKDLKFSYNPAWSPDGKQIAFEAQSNDGNRDIYIMNVNGNNVQRITTDEGLDQKPSWMPDGKKIVFTSNRYGYPDIFTINLDGTGVTPLTSHDVLDNDPAISPDGKSFVYSLKINTDENLYIRSLVTGGLLRLTYITNVSNSNPSWQPIPWYITLTPTANP
jgi:TolB protein